MIKYSFVLHHTEYKEFLEKLHNLGLVDINTMGWEPNDNERKLLSDIELHSHAISELSKREKNRKAEKFATAKDTFLNFVTADAETIRIEAAIAKLTKEIEDLIPWGDFSKEKMAGLAERGIVLNFFSVFKKEFETDIKEWSEKYTVEKISEINGTVYFVIVTTPDSEPISINALEVKQPTITVSEKRIELATLESELQTQSEIMDRCTEGIVELRQYGNELKENLHLSQVTNTVSHEVEGQLIVMEGWSTEETVPSVDKLIEETPGIISLKDTPKEEEDTPVLLKNNKFAKLFEVIGGLYALPKYGTMDMTPYYAPFYMMFFGFCMGDAGYGAIFVIAALIASFKVDQKLKPITQLVMYCGGAAIFFGILTGNIFGIEMAKWAIMGNYKDYFLTPDGLFPLAIGLGIVQILFGMGLRAVAITARQGIRYALSGIGWMIVIVSGLAAFLLPKLGVECYTMSSVPFYIVTGIGLFAMFFLNTPGRNPFFNFGLGLWNTYNDITGLLSDVLSYIRLFALGLSSGILALVFNKLAVGMSPDIIIVKQIVMLLILFAGQGINLFMATLSSFVHPLRLTFVEFYKNSGFEPGGRAFNPLKKNI